MRTDREKLIELIGEIPRVYYFALHQENDKPYEETLADHLIANGVTVQKHGRWVEKIETSHWVYEDTAECSVCGEEFVLGQYDMDDVRSLFKYCPSCGAKMDGEA